MELEVVAATEMQEALGVGIRVAGYANITTECRSEARVAQDGVGSTCIDRNDHWIVARVDKAEDEGVWIGPPGA